MSGGLKFYDVAVVVVVVAVVVVITIYAAKWTN
jgi:hypothetical protein